MIKLKIGKHELSIKEAWELYKELEVVLQGMPDPDAVKPTIYPADYPQTSYPEPPWEITSGTGDSELLDVLSEPFEVTTTDPDFDFESGNTPDTNTAEEFNI